MKSIIVNTRVLQRAQKRGAERYLSEVLARLESKIDAIAPDCEISGIKGNLWEQIILPIKIRGRLLWSPCDVGPLAIKNQVLTLHDVQPLDHPEWLNPRFTAWRSWLLPKLSRRVNWIITISEFSKSRIIRHLGAEENKVTVIPEAADERFSPQPKEKIRQILRELRMPSQSYLLSLGSLVPNKNLPRLLSAWGKILPYLPPDMWLVLCGAQGTDSVFKYVTLSETPDRVHFTGYVDDESLPALYSGAKAFVFPSLYEGFGLPPLEAMCCGVPVIASSAASLPEVVGDAAILVNPYDIDGIAKSIQSVLTDNELRNRMVEKGFDRASLYSWERTADETWKLLQKALHSSNN